MMAEENTRTRGRKAIDASISKTELFKKNLRGWTPLRMSTRDSVPLKSISKINDSTDQHNNFIFLSSKSSAPLHVHLV